jgi:hypothetical protein
MLLVIWIELQNNCTRVNGLKKSELTQSLPNSIFDKILVVCYNDIFWIGMT